jgi:hypothetical protein
MLLDSGLTELAKIKTLKEVSLHYSQGIRDEGIIELVQGVPGIESLNLTSTCIYPVITRY